MNTSNKFSSKKWISLTLFLTATVLGFFAVSTIIIDPCFHYHKPLSNLSYDINNERYQCNGIIRQWDYDSILIGSSVVHGMKPSLWDQLNNTHSIKVTYSGATFYELNQQLDTAFTTHPNIKTVVIALDERRLDNSSDATQYTNDISPVYLYDNNPLNDIEYLLNKDIFSDFTFHTIEFSKNTAPTPLSFDDFMNDVNVPGAGREYILSQHRPFPSLAPAEVPFTNANAQTELENIHQNIFSLTDAHPDTTFYVFFPPYNILFWGLRYKDGFVNYSIEAQELAIKELISRENIKLFSFDNNYELITNLDNYFDSVHYTSEIADQLLIHMTNGEYQITQENYQEYLSDIRNYYTNFDYTSLNY